MGVEYTNDNKLGDFLVGQATGSRYNTYSSLGADCAYVPPVTPSFTPTQDTTTLKNSIELDYSRLDNLKSHSSSTTASNKLLSYRKNPFERYISGIGFGILIILEVVSAPIWLLGFILHPILVTGKVFRVIVSAVVTFFMVYALLTWDLAMLALFLVSFGFIRTEKIVITGYTYELYKWITSGGDSPDEFWDLE